MAKLRGGTRIYGTGTVDTILYVNGNTVASSTNTGALQVAGGVGIGGNLYVGGVFSATSITIGGTNVGYGYTGSTGTIGYTGSIGFGYTGSASTASGYTGSIGVGYTGSASTATGYTGSIGYTGSKGNDGTSVTIQGSVATYTLLPGYPSSYGGAIGDGYITTDTGHLWVWSGSIWNDVGQIKGDTGDIGYTGSIGVGYTGSASTATGYTGSIGVGYTGSASTEIGYTGSQGTGGGAGYTGSASTASGYTGSLGYTGSIGESSYTYSDNPPVSPAVGDRWFDSSSGLEFVWTDDSNSTQWVEIAASGFLGQTGYTGSIGNNSILQSASIQSASGTGVNFTDIPSWVKRITILFTGISTNGSSDIAVRIGTSSGFENTGYFSSYEGINTGGVNSSVATLTTGFGLVSGVAAANIQYGIVTLVTMGNNIWLATGTLARDSSTDAAYFNSGSKTVAGTLDRVQLTTANGSDSFDAGSVNIIYE